MESIYIVSKGLIRKFSIICFIISYLINIYWDLLRIGVRNIRIYLLFRKMGYIYDLINKIIINDK